MNKDPYLSLNDDEFNKLSGIYKLLSSNTSLVRIPASPVRKWLRY